MCLLYPLHPYTTHSEQNSILSESFLQKSEKSLYGAETDILAAWLWCFDNGKPEPFPLVTHLSLILLIQNKIWFWTKVFQKSKKLGANAFAPDGILGIIDTCNLWLAELISPKTWRWNKWNPISKHWKPMWKPTRSNLTTTVTFRLWTPCIGTILNATTWATRIQNRHKFHPQVKQTWFEKRYRKD